MVYERKGDFAAAYKNGSRAQALGLNVRPDLLDTWRRKGNIVVPELK